MKRFDDIYYLNQIQRHITTMAITWQIALNILETTNRQQQNDSLPFTPMSMSVQFDSVG